MKTDSRRSPDLCPLYGDLIPLRKRHLVYDGYQCLSCTAADYDGLAYLHKVAEMGGHMEDLLFLSCAFEGLEHEADVGNFNGPWSASFQVIEIHF